MAGRSEELMRVAAIGMSLLSTFGEMNMDQRWLHRDALFDDQATHQARDLGLKVVLVDGTRPQAQLVSEVADWFGLLDA